MYKVRVWVEPSRYGEQIDVFVDDVLVERYCYGYIEESYDFERARSYSFVLKKRWEKRLVDLESMKAA